MLQFFYKAFFCAPKTKVQTKRSEPSVTNITLFQAGAAASCYDVLYPVTQKLSEQPDQSAADHARGEKHRGIDRDSSVFQNQAGHQKLSDVMQDAAADAYGHRSELPGFL